MHQINYIILIALFGYSTAVPLNNTDWIKDSLLAGNVAGKALVPMSFLGSFNGKNYYIESILKATFLESMQFCSAHEMRLVTILSAEENLNLGVELRDNGFTGEDDLFWSAGTRLPDDVHWIWMTTGQRITFTKWAPKEPNNSGGNEKCIELNRYRTTNKDLYWNDRNCADKLYFICESAT